MGLFLPAGELPGLPANGRRHDDRIYPGRAGLLGLGQRPAGAGFAVTGHRQFSCVPEPSGIWRC